MNNATLKKYALTICFCALSASASAQSGGSSAGVPASRPPQEVLQNTTAVVASIAAVAAIASLAHNSSSASNH